MKGPRVERPLIVLRRLAVGYPRCLESDTLAWELPVCFLHIKPSDGVIVGMYPVFQDEIGENADLTRGLHHLSGELIDS